MDKELSPGAERYVETWANHFAQQVEKGSMKQEDVGRRIEGIKRMAAIADKALETGGKEALDKGPGGILRETQKNKDVVGYRSAGSKYVDDSQTGALVDPSSLEGAAIDIVRHEYELSKEQNPQAREVLDKAYQSDAHYHAPNGGYGQAAFLKGTLNTLKARGLVQPVKGKTEKTTLSQQNINSLSAGNQK